MSDLVRVSATGAGVNYYPEFLSRTLGFYEEEGLQVEVEVLGNGPGVPYAVSSGSADVGLGGIWLPMLYRRRLDMFVPFAQLCNRLAAVLIGRTPTPRFNWSDVTGRIVLAPGGAPNFWMVFAAILRAEGIDRCGVRFVSDFVGQEVINLFRGGFGDFFIGMPPMSDVLIDEGMGTVVFDFAEFGEIPWSIFYAKPEFLNRIDNPAGRFARAIRRALRWILEYDPAEEPSVVRRFFSGFREDLIVASAASCRARGVWVPTVRIPEPALMRWQDIIVTEGRLIDAPMPYDEIVDPRPAEWADREVG